MKVKIVNEMDEFYIKATHPEALIIFKALEKYKPNEEDLIDINVNSWDKYEFTTLEKLKNKQVKLIKKLKKKLTGIMVY